ncbi:MAG: phosphatidate cytidylyltransferase [Candidatus Aureabacteria bacterium]|nr:phosphatidate cytidylyltransferase [Candidatus Auribacterota bacterium]
MVFIKRFCSAVLLVGVLILSVWFSRGPSAVLALVVASLLALGSVREYFGMLEAKGLKVFTFYGSAATVIFITTIFFDSYCHPLNDGVEYSAIIALITGLFILQAFERDPRVALGNIAGVLSGLVYIAWLWSFIFRVMYYPGVDGRWFVFGLFLIVKGGDMLAYVVGSTMGRHKLIPRISPKKTWEGAAGNLAGGLLAGLIIWKWFPCGFSLFAALGMGALLNILGQVGDLSESMLKRDADLKDSGGFIPGIGGMLDMLDSLLLTLPVLYLYLAFTR